MNLKSCTTLLLFVVALSVSCSSAKKAEMTDDQYGDAMETEHAEDTTEPSGAENLMGGSFEFRARPIEYGVVNGKKLNGYIAGPSATPPKGGIILIHEWWGLNTNINDMANKLASHGYVVLAVDMYGGEFASKPDDAKKLMMAAMEKPQAGVDNLKAARAFLAKDGITSVAVLGWCFGGGWALEAGLTQGDEIDAVIIYYGRVKTKAEELAELQAPVLGIFAALDQGIPVEQVKAFEEALDAAEKTAEIHVYDGVDHAFANPTGERFDPAAANDAWAKTLSFLSAHIRQ